MGGWHTRGTLHVTQGVQSSFKNKKQLFCSARARHMCRAAGRPKFMLIRSTETGRSVSCVWIGCVVALVDLLGCYKKWQVVDGFHSKRLLSRV